MKSKSELEAEITQAIVRFKKEYMGRGPLSARTYLLDDMALVRLIRGANPSRAEVGAGGREEPGT